MSSALPYPSGHGMLNTDLNPAIQGWIDFSWFGNTLAYVSADAPTYVFSINADVTGYVEPGMRVRLTQTTDKFFIVTAVGAYSGGVTQITVYGGTDYTLANAAISAGAFSSHKKPFGFPTDPAKWTETLTDTSTRTQSSPVANTWYNPGLVSGAFPIGAWEIAFEPLIRAYASATLNVNATLSTANNSESDPSLTICIRPYIGATAVARIPARRTKQLVLASKTTYYANVMTDGTASDIGFDTSGGSRYSLLVLAVCAYL